MRVNTEYESKFSPQIEKENSNLVRNTSLSTITNHEVDSVSEIVRFSLDHYFSVSCWKDRFLSGSETVYSLEYLSF